MVSDDVAMRIRWGKAPEQRSYLSEILDIIYGSGRRLSAVCGLKYEDLRLQEPPHGAIRWPADTDKMGREAVVPVSPVVRAAIDRVFRERPGIGPEPLFPSRDDLRKPVSRHVVDAWLRKAEKLTRLEPQEGSLWHAYRRGWATARKTLPVQDVAAAGGWKSHVVVRDIYTQADAETILDVVLHVGEVREAR